MAKQRRAPADRHAGQMSHEFEVANLPSSVHLVRSFVSHEIGLLPLSMEAQFELLAAVGEAADNVVLHGQAADPAPNVIRTRVSWTENDVQVEVIDNGPGFSPDVPAWTLPDAMSERGRGVFMMKMLVDDIGYSTGEHGSSCRLTKAFDCRRPSEPADKAYPGHRGSPQHVAPPNIYRSLVENAVEGIWVEDVDAVTAFVNQRTAEMLGCSPREMLGRSVFEFVDDDQAGEMSQIRERLAAGVTAQVEQVFRAKDGRAVHALVAVGPLHDDRGRYCGALSLLSDISDRVRTAEEREAALADLAETSEELAAANEELTALNEELHSANEELQAAGEEVSALNEELRTSNEDLLTLNQELEAIADMAQASSEATDLAHLLDALLSTVVRVLPADVGIVLAGHDAHVEAHATVGIADGARDCLTPEVCDQLAGRIMRTGRRVHVADVRKEKRLKTPLERLGLRSVLGAPLLCEGGMVGAIYVGWRQAHRRDYPQERLLAILAERAASTVVSATRREETNRQRDRLAELAKVLSNEREQLDAIIGSMADPLLVWGKDARIALANPALRRLSGRDVVGMSRTELIRRLKLRHADGALLKPRDLAASQVMGDEPLAEREMWLETPSGERKTVIAFATALEQEDLAAVVIWHDVTEERLLASERDYLASYPQTNPHPVMEISRGRLTYANPRGRKVFSVEQVGGPVPPTLRTALAAARRAAKLNARVTEIDVAVGDSWYRFSLFATGNDVFRLYGTDVTRRKAQEQSILKAKEEWERTFDSVPDLIQIVDSDHKILRVNKAMAERLGCEPEECIGVRCYEAAHGTTKPPKFCPHVRTIRDLKQHIEEVREPNLGGHFTVSTTPLLDDRGRMLASVHVAHDITAQKQAAQALQASEERLKRSQEIAHLGSWELDLVNGTLTWSDEVYRIFGLKPQEFGATYETFLDAVHPDDRAAVDDAYSGSIREGRDTYEIEHRVVRKDTGEIRIVHEKCQHYRDDAGRIVRSVGMVHDVTERRRAEDALRESEQRLRTIMDEMPIAMMLLSPQGATLETNRTANEMWGGPVPKASGPDDYELYRAVRHDTGKPLTPGDWPTVKTIERGEPAEETIDVPRNDGTTATVNARTIPIKDLAGNTTHILGVGQDITERVERQELSEALNSVAEAIHGSLHLDEIMLRVVTEAGRAMGCTTAAVSIRQPGGRWIIRHAYGLDTAEAVGRTTIDRQERHALSAIETRKMVIVHDARTDRRINKAHLKKSGVRSLISLPIATRTEPVGVVSFNYDRPRAFSDAEIEFCRRLQSSLSLAVENSMLYESERLIAQTLQRRLLPAAETIPGLRFAHIYHSAAEAALVGGDFYDIFALDDSRVAVLVGDVSGKGVKAAGLTESVRNAVRALSYGKPTLSPAQILGKVNDSFLRQLPATEFVTAVMLIMDIKSGRYVGTSAGHPQPVTCGSDCRSIELPVGAPLGVASAGYQNGTGELPKSESLVLYTDGLTEARHGSELYGEERLISFLSNLTAENPKEVAEALLAEARRFARGRLEDDLVVVVLRRGGGS